MKTKRLISTLRITLAITFGAFAVGYSQKQVKKVKAAVDDILYFVNFDASTIPSSYRDQCNNFRIYIWYNDSSLNREFFMHELGYQDLYTANVTLYDGNEPAGYQLTFDQNGVRKYSVDLSGNDFVPYKSGGAGINYLYSFSDEWIDGKWSVTLQTNRTRISISTPQHPGLEFNYYEAAQGYLYVSTETNISTSADIVINLQFGSEFDANNDYLYCPGIVLDR